MPRGACANRIVGAGTHADDRDVRVSLADAVRASV